MRRRSMLVHGLVLTLSRPRAVLWAYAFNVGFAVLFSLRLHAQLNDVLGHSIAAQRLATAADLGVAGDAVARVYQDAPSTGIAGFLGVFFYLLVYFVLVPGALFCYQTEAPARLSIMLSIGFQRFWRFFRIALLTLVVSALVLGPLVAGQLAWAGRVDQRAVGWTAVWETLAGWVVVGVVAAVLRLYFDLVEVYTLSLGEQLRPDGRPDRRVRKVLLPALRTLRRNFWRASGSFLLLMGLGLSGVVFTGRIAMHMLAQPRVWPMFLLVQAGMLFLLFTRFWQRGAETVLCFDHRLAVREAKVSEATAGANPA